MLQGNSGCPSNVPAIGPLGHMVSLRNCSLRNAGTLSLSQSPRSVMRAKDVRAIARSVLSSGEFRKDPVDI